MTRLEPDQFVRDLRSRPLEFTQGDTYPERCALVMGYDGGLGNGTIVDGFQEWLSRRYGVDPNVVFWHHVARLAVPAMQGSSDIRVFDRADQDRANEILVDLLAAYLDDHPIEGHGRSLASALEEVASLASAASHRLNAFTWFGTLPEAVALIVGFAYATDPSLLLVGFKTWLSDQSEWQREGEMLPPMPLESAMHRRERFDIKPNPEEKEAIKRLFGVWALYVGQIPR